MAAIMAMAAQIKTMRMATSRSLLPALHATDHEIPGCCVGSAAVEVGGRVAPLHGKLYASVEELVHRPLRVARGRGDEADCKCGSDSEKRDAHDNDLPDRRRLHSARDQAWQMGRALRNKQARY
jgi:hypothetical protein